MLTIGIDPHKQTHTGVAVDALGVAVAQRTVAARRAGFGQMLDWARTVDSERVGVVGEDLGGAGVQRELWDSGTAAQRHREGQAVLDRITTRWGATVIQRGSVLVKASPPDPLSIAYATERGNASTGSPPHETAPSPGTTPAAPGSPSPGSS